MSAAERVVGGDEPVVRAGDRGTQVQRPCHRVRGGLVLVDPQGGPDVSSPLASAPRSSNCPHSTSVRTADHTGSTRARRGPAVRSSRTMSSAQARARSPTRIAAPVPKPPGRRTSPGPVPVGEVTCAVGKAAARVDASMMSSWIRRRHAAVRARRRRAAPGRRARRVAARAEPAQPREGRPDPFAAAQHEVLQLVDDVAYAGPIGVDDRPTGGQELLERGRDGGAERLGIGRHGDVRRERGGAGCAGQCGLHSPSGWVGAQPSGPPGDTGEPLARPYACPVTFVPRTPTRPIPFAVAPARVG